MRGNVRAGLITAGIVLVAAGGVLFVTQPTEETVAAPGEYTALRRVSTLVIERRELRQTAEVAGVLEARRSVQLQSETEGRVVAVGAESLDAVAAGQLLVEVDPLLAEVALERAEAEVAKRSSELRLAESNLARRRSLAEREVVSDAVLDDAENAERVARAALRESRAERRRARDALAKKTIAAPFSGVLRDFPVEVGESLQVGQRLGELLDLSTARATIGLADHQVVHVAPGEPVGVAVEAYPNEDFAGTILRVGRAADPSSKKFPVEIELQNVQGRLLPGMIVRVRFDLGSPERRLTIPREATLEEFGLRVVYVIAPSEDPQVGVAERRRITVRSLPFRPSELEVVSGLEAGERIAIAGLRQLRDGERVRIGGST